MLLEVTNDAKLALKYHQAFTAEVIASITDGDSDRDMDEAAILKWISRQS